MLIQFALSLVVLLGFCGLALDVGLLELKQLQLQNAADAAAIGAVYGSQSAGLADAALNGFKAGVGTTITFASPPSSGAYTAVSSAVQATLTTTASPLFFATPVTLTAQATALPSASGCFSLLSTVSTQPSLSLSTSTLSGDCPFYLGRSFNLDYTSQSFGAQFLVAGPSSASASSSGTVAPTPRFDVARQSDPLSYVPSPVFVSCDKSSAPLYFSGDVTLMPGTYCGGWNTNSYHVTLSQGTYILTGTTHLNNATVTGTGVTLFLTAGGGFGYGVLEFNQSNVALSAPLTGSLQGILIFADRNWKDGTRGVSFVNSPCNCNGILYLPYLQVYDSQSTLSGSRYFSMVADTTSINVANVAISSDYSSLQNGNPMRSGSVSLAE